MEACQDNEICHVLVAEDDPSNMQLTLAILGYAICHVSVAETGLEALQAAKKTHFGLILMDVQMPVMDGIEATKLIRQLEIDDRKSPALIVGVTASAMVAQVQMCIEAGMDSVLIKPISVADLLGLVNEACKKSKGNLNSL